MGHFKRQTYALRLVWASVTSKKLPNVYKSLTTMISLEK